MENINLDLNLSEKIYEKLQDHLKFSGLTKNQYISLLILDAEDCFKESPVYHKSLKEKYY